jgi:hypothetical protein
MEKRGSSGLCEIGKSRACLEISMSGHTSHQSWDFFLMEQFL